MSNKEDNIDSLIENAMALMEQAERHEKLEEFESAMFKYQQAVDILSKSGISRQKLDEIYNRIAILNQYSKRQKKKSVIEINPQELQDQAFQMIDVAKKLEIQEQFSDALENYLQAVQILIQAGWDQSQIQGFQSEIERVQQKIAKLSTHQTQTSSSQDEYIPTYSKLDQTSEANKLFSGNADAPVNKEPSVNVEPSVNAEPSVNTEPSVNAEPSEKKEYIPTFARLDPQISGSQDVDLQDPVKAKKFFEDRKKKIANLQNEAFNVLDLAKKEEENKNYEQAIGKYVQAIEMLNEIGWVNETNRIYDEIERINQKIAFEAKKAQQKAKDLEEQSKISDSKLEHPTEPESEIKKEETGESQIFSALEIKKKKKEEEKLQNEAFELIDQADHYAKRKEFDPAIANYNRAIVILNSIGWQNYTKNIQTVIQNLIQDKNLYEKEETKKKIHENISPINNATSKKEILRREFELRRQRLKKFEENKQKEKNIQDLAFELINEGEELVKDFKYDEALTKYNQAVELLISIGWQSQVQMLNNLMAKIHEEKVRVEIIKQQEKMERVKRQSQERTLQNKISAKSDTSSETSSSLNIEQRKEYKQKKKHIEELQTQALDLLEKANNIAHNSNPDYDSAIKLYKNSYDLLVEAGWSQELNNISQMIKGLEKEKIQRQAEKQRMEALKEKTIQEHNSFQESLKEQMDEFETQKEEQRKKLQEFQEKQQREDKVEKEAFDWMNKAERFAEKKSYMEAAECYQKAIDKFDKINWTTQIAQIENEVNKMFKLNRQKEEELKLQEEIQRKQHQQMELKKKQEEEQKQQELDNIMDIKSMIRAVANKTGEDKSQNESVKKDVKIEADLPVKKDVKKEVDLPIKKDVKKDVDTRIKKDNEKEIDYSFKKEQLISLRDSIRSTLKEKENEKEKLRENADEKDKMKEDLNEFKKMIKDAAEKSKK